jgi:hypothetical protein
MGFCLSSDRVFLFIFSGLEQQIDDLLLFDFFKSKSRIGGSRQCRVGLSPELSCSKKINHTEHPEYYCGRGPEGPRQLRGNCRQVSESRLQIDVAVISSQTCKAPRQGFFALVFRVNSIKDVKHIILIALNCVAQRPSPKNPGQHRST